MRDLSRLFENFNRISVGFQPTFDLLDEFSRIHQNTPNYPPYDLEKLDDSNYRITIALAGFSSDDIDIELQNNVLTIKGEIKRLENANTTYLFKGISGRSFQRTFMLDKNVQVISSVFGNGLLMINLLHQIPDHIKPRKIEINSLDKTLDSSGNTQ